MTNARQIDPFARLLGLLLLVLVVATCGRPAAAPTTAAPAERSADRPTGQAQHAAPSDLLFVREATQRAEVAVVDARAGKVVRSLPYGASSPDGSMLYRAEFSAGNTVVRAIETATGRTVRELTLADRNLYELPAVGIAGEAGGLSPNGRWLALRARGVDYVTKSAFLVLDTELARPANRVELEGNFAFDALSDDGRSLYLFENVPPAQPAGYRVRVYDLAEGALVPGVIADKGSGGDQMQGFRVGTAASPDGRWLFSLYANEAAGPFIHALNLVERFAVCLFLSKQGSGDHDRKNLLWALASSRDRTSLYAVNAALGIVAEIDTVRVTIRRTAAFSVARAEDDGGPLAALARWFFPVAEAKRVPLGAAVLSPDGRTLFALGESGIFAIATEDLSLRWHRSSGVPFDSLAISPDGERLYAVSGERSMLFRIDAETGKLGGRIDGVTQPLSVLRVEAAR